MTSARSSVPSLSVSNILTASAPNAATPGRLAASVPAVLVAYAIARGRVVRVWRLVAWAAVGAAGAVAVTLIDLARPPQARTHLGRFAAHLFSGGLPDAAGVVTRKIQSNVGILGSAWTWTVVIAVVVLALILWADPSALSSLRRTRPMLSAALGGTLVAGVIGFVVNDTGIWVLGMALAYVVPSTVLSVVDGTGPRTDGPPIVLGDGRTRLQGSAEAAGRQRQGRP